MSRINLTTGSYQRTFSFDKETLEGIIEDNFLPQTPEKLLKLLDTLDYSGALDDAVDVLYDTIENLLVNYARIIAPESMKMRKPIAHDRRQLEELLRSGIEGDKDAVDEVIADLIGETNRYEDADISKLIEVGQERVLRKMEGK